jgi:hypothetical protein
MDAERKEIVASSPADSSFQSTVPVCAHLGTHSCLHQLVAELLYKNQVLRFNRLELRNQLERIKDLVVSIDARHKNSQNVAPLLMILNSFLQSKEEDQHLNATYDVGAPQSL